MTVSSERVIVMKVTIELDSIEDNARQYIAAPEAFSLLWEIDQKARAELKYGSEKVEELVNALEEIRAMIADTNLLRYYE